MKPARLIEVAPNLYEIEGMEIDFNGPTREFLRLFKTSEDGNYVVTILVFEPSLLEWARVKANEIAEVVSRKNIPVIVRVVETRHAK